MQKLGNAIRAEWEEKIGIPAINGPEPGTTSLEDGDYVVGRDPRTGRTRIRKRLRVVTVRGNGLPGCRRCPFNGGCDGGDNCLLEISAIADC